MKIIKYTMLVLFIIGCFCFAKIMIYMFTGNVQYNKTNWSATTTQPIIDLPNEEYDCKKLKAVIGADVEFCKLKTARPIIFGQPMVMGDFNRLANRIRITHETTNDAIAHEFIHYAIACKEITKDEELCVRSAQKMLLELNLIKQHEMVKFAKKQMPTM